MASKGRPPKVTEAMRKEMVERYLSGQAMSKIALALDLGTTTVRTHLYKSGLMGVPSK